MKRKRQPDKKTITQLPSHIPFIQLPRSAGILLHITSLPSLFAIGDFGPQAYRFADFLHRSHQSIWQILPINSTSSEQGFSPYGSDGCFGGNSLLISPELLVKDGLLTKNDISSYIVKGAKKTEYDKAQKIKTALLDKAYANYQSNSFSKNEFHSFCQQENDWLHHYTLYIVLKQNNANKSWNQWKTQYKNADKKALQAFTAAHQKELDKIKWQQWIFHKQWYELKAYCNHLGIKILGDIPFYVAYDSADVWINKTFFNLDRNGVMLSESGAPPDDFNADGQRWGMPVYCWDVMKKDKYKWWINRIKKNAAMFDFVRLDHFRGFSAYWNIRQDAKSATEGEWKPAPGKDFFSLLQDEIGSLPFVAEDLGSINEPVLRLRDEFQLPGMVILQVAFGEDMPKSESIPHHHNENTVVYTGNHDNNTTLSWFTSLPAKLAKNVSLYVDKEVTKDNICDITSQLVYSSVAKLAVLPMQDILKLDEHARMNSVPDEGASWSWRMPANALTKKIEKQLLSLCYLYDRQPKKNEIKKEKE